MNTLLYYTQKIQKLGMKKSCLRLKARLVSLYQYHRLKRLWKQKKQTTWENAQKYFDLKSSTQILVALQKNTFFKEIFNHDIFQKRLPTNLKNLEFLQNHANQITKQQITVFGTVFDFSAGIPWRCDAKKPTHVWPYTFYKDIVIQAPFSTHIEEYHADIKFPWELSRLHQLSDLGIAYHTLKQSNPTVAVHYVDAFCLQMNSWFSQNQYLTGVNWICPMDVAIRAINMLWALYFFSTALLPETFIEQYVCSLYDHLTFLESNWETSATPNNHYLADLIGHLYLLSFFKLVTGLKSFNLRKQKAIKVLTAAFKEQRLEDNTQYEGSTSYHRLVTEFFLHFYLLQESNTQKNLTPILNDLFSLVDATSITEQTFIQIGDTDSGKLLFGIAGYPSEINLNKTFNKFGIFITKKNNWLISERTPTQTTTTQPSGHFHHDTHSITISYKKKPIIVDPGSYLYTANRYARNLFRSEMMHNAPYLVNQNNEALHPIRSFTLDTFDLFQLPCNKNSQLNTKRTIVLNTTEECVTITDTVTTIEKSHALGIIWNFIFYPGIEVFFQNNSWCLKTDSMNFIFQSSLLWKLIPTHYATRYGTKQDCLSLIGFLPLQKEQQIYSINIKLIKH